jgi:hypothetical protein
MHAAYRWLLAHSTSVAFTLLLTPLLPQFCPAHHMIMLFPSAP